MTHGMYSEHLGVTPTSDERALKCVDFIIEKPSHLIHKSKCETQTKGRVLEQVEFSDRFVCSFESRESRVMNRRPCLDMDMWNYLHVITDSTYKYESYR